MLTNRPLPPHLTIYKPQLTSTFPISHRISGAFLATMVLFSPLLCPKMGLISFTYENFYQSSPSLPKFILSAVDLTTLALCYHMSNGVRHLWRDFAVRLTSFFDIYRYSMEELRELALSLDSSSHQKVLLLAFCLFSGKSFSPMPSDDCLSLQAAVGTFLPPEHADRRPVRFIFNEQAQASHMEGETL